MLFVTAALALLAGPWLDAARADFEVTGSDVTEGDANTFGLTTGCIFGCTLWYRTRDDSAVSGACPSADHNGGEGSASVGTFAHNVFIGTCDDNVHEYGPESFRLEVTDVDGFPPGPRTKAATGVIRDNDPAPVVDVSDTSATEGDTTGSTTLFTLTKPQAASRSVTVSWTTEAGTAVAGQDFDAATGSVTWSALDTAPKDVGVNVRGDVVDEPNETVSVRLTGVTNGGLGRALGTATIADNDAPPSLSISDADVAEGDVGLTSVNFSVVLSRASELPISVDYETADGSARASIDYLSMGPSQLSFAPGQTARIVSAHILADQVNESDEDFFVNVSQPTNSTLGDGSGRALIDNDDFPRPAISIEDRSVAEGNAGPTSVTLAVTLAHPTEKPVSINYAPGDRTANTPSDYLGPPPGTLTFAVGQTKKPITTQVLGDGVDEPTEAFAIELSSPQNGVLGKGTGIITIEDDDLPPETDVDRDTFSPEEGDCVDTDDRVFPGATDVVQNGLNEDCVGDDASFPGLPSPITIQYEGTNGGLRVSSLVVKQILAGTRIEVRCMGRPCRRSLRHVRTVRRPARAVNLRRLFRRRTLRPGAVLTVLVTKPEFLGRVRRDRIRRKQAVPNYRCLDPRRVGQPIGFVDRSIRPRRQRPGEQCS